MQIKAEKTGLIFTQIFLVLIGVLGLFFVIQDSSVWQFAVIALVGLALIHIWLASFKITIANSNLEYRELKSKNKISIPEIKKIYLKIGLSSEKQKRGYYRMYIEGENNQLIINIKPFSKNNLAILVDTLVKNNPSIELDKYSSDIRKGNLDTVVKVGISNVWQIIIYVFLMSLVVALVRQFID